MMAPRFVLAIDGGGSKTVATLLTLEGEPLATVREGPANLYRDPAAGLATVHDAWRKLCASVGLAPDASEAETIVSAGFAGIGGEVQRQAFARAFAGFARRVLSSDGYTAFVGVFGQGVGALLAIGTGVVAYRRLGSGPPAIASGWGFPAADRGGGAWLGLRLVGDYLDHLDGAATIPASSLWAEAAGTVGREREPILTWLREARAADFAGLAPAIVAAAAAGDPLGRALVAEGRSHILRLAQALTAGTELPLALAGGLAGLYRGAIEAALASGQVLAESPPDPVRGAWLIAAGAMPPEFPEPDQGESR